MNHKIIELENKHLNACFDLDQKSLKGLWTKSQWKRELTDPKRICLGVIELKSKKLLGLCTAWIVIDELHITSIAVHPTHQRKGLGKFLLSDLIKRSYSLPTKNMHLEVKDTNEPAKAFYKSMGFKVIANRSDFYKDGSNALVLAKEFKNESEKQ